MASIAVLLQLRHDRGGAVFSLLPTYAEHDLQNFYAPSAPLTDDEAVAE